MKDSRSSVYKMISSCGTIPLIENDRTFPGSVVDTQSWNKKCSARRDLSGYVYQSRFWRHFLLGPICVQTRPSPLAAIDFGHFCVERENGGSDIAFESKGTIRSARFQKRDWYIHQVWAWDQLDSFIKQRLEHYTQNPKCRAHALNLCWTTLSSGAFMGKR